MSKLVSSEKKLQILRQQLTRVHTPILPKLSGKKDILASTNLTFDLPLPSQLSPNVGNTNYLKKDLSKICILTAVALGFQLTLHWSLQHNLLKIPLGF